MIHAFAILMSLCLSVSIATCVPSMPPVKCPDLCRKNAARANHDCVSHPGCYVKSCNLPFIQNGHTCAEKPITLPSTVGHTTLVEDKNWRLITCRTADTHVPTILITRIGSSRAYYSGYKGTNLEVSCLNDSTDVDIRWEIDHFDRTGCVLLALPRARLFGEQKCPELINECEAARDAMMALRRRGCLGGAEYWQNEAFVAGTEVMPWMYDY